MRINKIIEKTLAEGPGCRLCIWVQGCSHGCDGCFATELWDYNGGYDISLDEIKEKINSVKNDIEGITLLGGEPFDKANELLTIAKYAKALGKNVIAFSGYTTEELTDEYQKELLKYVDVLLDGEFKKELLDYSRPLVGSSNQRIIFLSNDIPKEQMLSYKNRFEIRANDKGKITFNGMGNIEKLNEYINKLKGE